MVQTSLTNSLSPSGSVLKWYEEQGSKKTKPLQANTTIYNPWNYAPNGVTSTFNYIQGIGAGASKDTYTIVGTYGQLDNGAIGVVYQGSINGTNTSQGSGPGTWTTMVVPKSFNSLGTSIYGVHNKGRGQFDLVGTYVSKTQTTNIGGTIVNDTLGFYYAGEITSISPKTVISKVSRPGTRLPVVWPTKPTYIALAEVWLPETTISLVKVRPPETPLSLI